MAQTPVTNEKTVTSQVQNNAEISMTVAMISNDLAEKQLLTDTIGNFGKIVDSYVGSEVGTEAVDQHAAFVFGMNKKQDASSSTKPISQWKSSARILSRTNSSKEGKHLPSITSIKRSQEPTITTDGDLNFVYKRQRDGAEVPDFWPSKGVVRTFDTLNTIVFFAFLCQTNELRSNRSINDESLKS
ncbi:signal-transducing histidine kinase-like protein [Corchorus olitorius]|uniref:Signal-transducing histidine kinase-like protein n=1 Tax=Corchorus olitorius TaxID=93759 RepID=A0A1R3J5C6_9ROSI|nr:signal-transducing histidine kinase-like protein [Corchorus olitorius]